MDNDMTSEQLRETLDQIMRLLGEDAMRLVQAWKSLVSAERKNHYQRQMSAPWRQNNRKRPRKHR